ncbi:MAG: CoA transferase [Dehalococcoidia bacterium]|nr:MAG: CoA transferase [Dehalococcoidia bacterium]
MSEEKRSGFLPPYRVLDLTDEKGVFCGKLLGDLGADVIKVEPPGGDKIRAKGPFHENDVHPEKSLYFLYYNTSKGSITLNLEHADGRAIFKRLIESADALVESFPVGYMSGLGLDYPVLKEWNPRLVMASITPFGQTGPHKDFKSSDLIVMGMSGYMQVTGDPYGVPVRFGDEQSHFAPSQYGSVAVVAALYYRDAVSGTGQYIDISMQEAVNTYCCTVVQEAGWLVTGENIIRQGPTSPWNFPSGLYSCKDGWIGMYVVTAEHWDALSQWMYEVTGNEEILDEKYKGGLLVRHPYIDILEAMFLDFTGNFTAQEIFQEGQRRGIATLPVNSAADLLVDPQLVARDFWVELDHPVVGRMKYPRGAMYGDDIPPPRKAAPLLGEDNERIYCSELGYTKQQLAVLRTAGVI